ncbi:hypothetical protein ACWDTR_24970 [Streptomyces sp. NPDC003470]
MGVFERIFRRSKTTEEASAAERPAEAPASGSATDGKPDDANVPAATGESASDTDTAEAADSESVGIPKQQSAEEAVDNEADKGART